MDLETVLAPVATGALDSVASAVTLGAPVLILLIGIGIFLRVSGKFGIKR